MVCQPDKHGSFIMETYLFYSKCMKVGRCLMSYWHRGPSLRRFSLLDCFAVIIRLVIRLIEAWILPILWNIERTPANYRLHCKHRGLGWPPIVACGAYPR